MWRQRNNRRTSATLEDERQILLRSSSGSQACESTYHRTRELAMTTKRVFHVPNLVEETSLAELTLQGVTSGATV